MSNWYKKGKGRKSSVENASIRTVNDLIEQNNIDISKYDSPTTPNELYELRNKLLEEYGSPVIKKDVLPSETTENVSAQEPILDDSSKTNFQEPEPVETPVESQTQSTRTFELSDFVEQKSDSPFTDEFPAEDMHKATSDFPSYVPEPTPPPESSQAIEQVSNDSVPDAWEQMKKKRDRGSALGTETVEATAEPVSSTPKSDKVPLADETKRKATESMARQMAKITTFLAELGVKKVSKLSDKHIDKLEDQGLIDRNFEVNGRTVAELLDDHNDLIDKMIEVDPQSKNDLVEAIKLVAEKHQIEMSPESNLAMVVVTIIISLAQAGLSQKKEFKKTLKKISDTYTMQKRQIAPMEEEIARLRAENIAQNNGSAIIGDGAPIHYPIPPEPAPDLEAPVRELSFNNTTPESKLNIVRKAPEQIEQASAVMEEIDTEVEETVVIKKGGRTATKKGTAGRSKKK
jgi:hypothetical protein